MDCTHERRRAAAWRDDGICGQHGPGCRLVRQGAGNSLYCDIAPRCAAEQMRAIEKLGARLPPGTVPTIVACVRAAGISGVDATFIHAFDDLNVMAGNGTIGLEILEDLPDVETVVVPWGGWRVGMRIASAVRQPSSIHQDLCGRGRVGGAADGVLEGGSPQVIEPVRSFVVWRGRQVGLSSNVQSRAPVSWTGVWKPR